MKLFANFFVSRNSHAVTPGHPADRGPQRTLAICRRYRYAVTGVVILFSALLMRPGWAENEDLITCRTPTCVSEIGDAPYVFWRVGESPAPIVLPVTADGTALTWATLTNLHYKNNTDQGLLRDAVEFLREGLEKMTGHKPPVLDDGADVAGIQLFLSTTLPAELRNDPRVQAAIANDPDDPYAAHEAFYTRRLSVFDFSRNK